MTGTRIETAVHIVLIVGFLAVDFLLFHDALKPGELITPVEWLVGALSALVLVSSGLALLKPAVGHRVA
jgi:hypothetical protein